MRGAHDNGSHGSKCLMGLRPGKRRDCGNGAESWEWAWAIAGTTCRSVKRHTSCLAMANAPATTMSAEKTRKRVLLVFPVFGSNHDVYQDQSDGQRHQGQQKQRFFHGISSRTLWFRFFDVRFFCAC